MSKRTSHPQVLRVFLEQNHKALHSKARSFGFSHRILHDDADDFASGVILKLFDHANGNTTLFANNAAWKYCWTAIRNHHKDLLRKACCQRRIKLSEQLHDSVASKMSESYDGAYTRLIADGFAAMQASNPDAARYLRILIITHKTGLQARVRRVLMRQLGHDKHPTRKRCSEAHSLWKRGIWSMFMEHCRKIEDEREAAYPNYVRLLPDYVPPYWTNCKKSKRGLVGKANGVFIRDENGNLKRYR